MGFSGYIRLMVSVGAVAEVVSIQTSGVICVGREVVVALHSCKEHFDFMLASPLGIGGSDACWWISQRLERCRDVVELSISLLTYLKLCAG